METQAPVPSPEPPRVKIAALYRFAQLADAAALRPLVRDFCTSHGLTGTILIAPEGINGTVAGPEASIDALVAWLETFEAFKGRFSGAEVKCSFSDKMPFYRLKVRLKQEIVTLRAPQANPALRVGTYVAPEDWNDLIARDDVVLIDTRNDYEVGLGTFRGAQDPATKNFTEFKSYAAGQLDPTRDKKIAMFCTGGIRCEKASSYLLSQGFSEVFHLKGGILNYLEQIPKQDSAWEGECFVFDERVSVGHGLVQGDAALCRACRHPLSADDRSHPQFVLGVQCPYCSTKTDRRRAEARQAQIALAQARGEAHIGDKARQVAVARTQAKKARRAADRMRSEG